MTILSGDVIANSAPNFPDRAKPSLGHLQGAASGPETPAIGRVGQNRRWKSAIRLAIFGDPGPKTLLRVASPSHGATLSAGRARSAQGLDRAQKVIDAARCSSFFSRQNRG
jgi:hypothetical protein